MSNVVNGMDEPLSPDSQAYVDNYSPSNESPSLVAFFGRRRLRIINGQDPEQNPERFTPRVSLKSYKWPTDEEARLFAEKAIGRRLQVRDQVQAGARLRSICWGAPAASCGRSS